MSELVRGGNAPLSTPRVTVTFSCSAPADLSALLVDRDLRVRSDKDLIFYNAPSGPGVSWSENAIDLDLGQVPGEVQAVLITLSLAGSTFGAIPPPRFSVADVTFVVDRLDTEQAIVGLELYRRNGGWKVRAVGQGYAGGLAELVTDFGVDVTEEAAEPAPEAPIGMPQQPHAPSSGQVPYVDRVWMVWEDASRSLASFRSACDHALALRDEEIAGRMPRGRSDELILAATARLNTDVEQLVAELGVSENEAPPELAPFESVSWLTWDVRTELGEGLLLGRLHAEESPELRVPLILRMPWRRGVWINRGPAPADSVAVAWSLATRFLAAVPGGFAGLEVIDPTGLSGAGWLHGFPEPIVSGLLGGGVALGNAAGRRLGQLLDLIDLRSVGGDDEEIAGSGPPVRLVLIFDVGAALEEYGDQLIRLIDSGPSVGVPVILVETDTPTDESVRALRIKQASHTLPSSEGNLSDGWVGGDWTLIPDILPDSGGTRPPLLFSHVLGEHARSMTRD
ncbi:MAG: TerD family protein [Streptosporangiaceae bacterium]